VRNRRSASIRLLAKNLHHGEIAQIVLPIAWAMCEVLWYGMALVAHPHDYPHVMHIFCGHREWEGGSPAPLSPFPLRGFMLMEEKHLFGSSVWAPMPTFVPWSGQMSAYAMKTRHVGYRCSHVIHNFSFNQGIERPVQSDQTHPLNLLFSFV